MSTFSSSTLEAPAPAGLAAASPDLSTADVKQTLEWLRGLERAPYVPPAPRLRDDVPANGKLYVCSHAGGVAMGFEGHPDFIARWFNWAHNTAVIGPNARLHWYAKGYVGSLGYVCADSIADIKRGLALQFAWEIRKDWEIAPTVYRVIDQETNEHETIWPQAEIDALAAGRAEEFFAERVILNEREGVVFAKPIRPEADHYVLSLPKRQGRDLEAA